MTRWGLTVPLGTLPLGQHAELIRALPGLGYTDVWSLEVSQRDAFTPLALASAWEPTLRLGTAIVPAYTRGPATLAMSAAALADAAPGRFVLGLGSSSPVVVQSWNGIEFTDPLRRTRDVLRFVRAALAGERVDGAFDTFQVQRFRLDAPPEVPPPLYLAALRPRMLALAGAEADGVILNWLAASDVPRCLDAVGNPTLDVVARIFVCPIEDAARARALGRRYVSSYLTTPGYSAFHDWLGRGEVLAEMHQRWAAGDRAGATGAVPDGVVDALVLHGSPESCRDQVRAYVDAGVSTPVLSLVPGAYPTDNAALLDLLRRIGPT